MARAAGTKDRALKEARGLMQSFGFNGFSFQDVADAIGIRKPSLYDHFESKEELGKDLVSHYAAEFRDWTETIAIFAPLAKIGALFELFSTFALDAGKLCPLSALAADYNSLPKSLRKPLAKASEFQAAWLKGVIEDGQKDKTIRSDLSSDSLASLVHSAGLGVQLIARVNADADVIRHLKDQMLQIISPNTQKSMRSTK